MTHPAARMPVVFRLFWIAPMLAGALMAVSGVQNMTAAENSTAWTPVDATVIRVGGQQGWLVTKRWGTYQWRLGDTVYTGSEIDCCHGTWSDWFERAGEKKQGDAVTVFVDPDNPARAVAVTGAGRHCWKPLAVGAGLLVAGLFIRRRITADAAHRTRAP